MIFGPASAPSAFEERGTELKAVHHFILTVTNKPVVSEISNQMEAAVDEFHAVHVVENGRWKRVDKVARDTIYKIGVEQSAFFVSNDYRDLGKRDRGLDGQNAVFIKDCGKNGGGLSWALPFWHVLLMHCNVVRLSETYIERTKTNKNN